MRQAIETKYLGPTNTRGSRVKAKADAGSITVGWRNDLDPADNHREAARQLAERLGWFGDWIGGSTDKGYAFVCISDDPRDGFNVPKEG